MRERHNGNVCRTLGEPIFRKRQTFATRCVLPGETFFTINYNTNNPPMRKTLQRTSLTRGRAGRAWHHASRVPTNQKRLKKAEFFRRHRLMRISQHRSIRVFSVFSGSKSARFIVAVNWITRLLSPGRKATNEWAFLCLAISCSPAS